MASFEVEVLPSALGEWTELPSKDARREVAGALETLRREPYPPGSFRLVEESKRRLYLTRGVVVYLVDREPRSIWVLEVRSRRRPRP